jgi:acyl-CoA reductase-like NAD-dependent aldehyde dehydrogenase
MMYHIMQVSKIQIGAPMADGTKLGPVVSQAQQQKVLGFIDRARASGVKVCCNNTTASTTLILEHTSEHCIQGRYSVCMMCTVTVMHL